MTEHHTRDAGTGKFVTDAYASEHPDTTVHEARRPRVSIELLCEVMHDAYEQAALGAGWETQQASRKPWAEVPPANQATMRAAVEALLDFLRIAHRPTTPATSGCQAAASQRGVHISCDEPEHHIWPHGNREHEIIWTKAEQRSTRQAGTVKRGAHLADMEPALVDALHKLGEQYGPMGVAVTAACLTDPDALTHRLAQL